MNIDQVGMGRFTLLKNTYNDPSLNIYIYIYLYCIGYQLLIVEGEDLQFAIEI